MLKFATAALVLLLSWFGGPVHGEISPGFANCRQFFYQNTIPQGIIGDSYAAICQVYKNEHRFATLYDKNGRIPLYSAYKLKTQSSRGKRPDEEDWKIEPQLAGIDRKEMMYQTDLEERVKESQAVDEDYKDTIYTKGHLAPSGHQTTVDDQRATFTLTNAVPQRLDFNSGPWSNLEQKVLKNFKKFCTSDMYVITGVIPYESGKHMIKNRVHIPEYMWTTYCCPSPSNGAYTYAAVGRNDRNSDDKIVKKDPNQKTDHFKGFDVEEKSLEDLEKILKERLNMPEISLFKNQCKGE